MAWQWAFTEDVDSEFKTHHFILCSIYGTFPVKQRRVDGEVTEAAI